MRKKPDKDDTVSVGLLSLKACIFCTVYKKQVKASAGFAASGKELVSAGFFMVEFYLRRTDVKGEV